MSQEKTLTEIKEVYRNILDKLEEVKRSKNLFGKKNKIKLLLNERRDLYELIKKPCSHSNVIEICQGKGCIETKNPLLVRVCTFCEVYEKTPPGFNQLKKSTVIKKINEEMLW